MKELRFSNEVIANIAKVLQLAMLTGTDIVDNLKMIKLAEGKSGFLEIHKDFKSQIESNIEKMLSEINVQDNLKDIQP